MKSLVIFESMYGNTRQVAAAIAAGLSSAGDVTVVSVAEASRAMVDASDLLVVGGPTHAHGLSRVSTRAAAADAAHNPDKRLTLEPEATGRGLREWFKSMNDIPMPSAAFDTRVNLPEIFTGHAAGGVGKLLRTRGSSLVAQPESFLVDRENRLVEGELARAREWGVHLSLCSATDTPSR